MVRSKKRIGVDPKQLYGTLVEANDDLIFVVGLDGRYVLFNERGLNKCGFSRKDVIGKTPVQAFGRKLGTPFHKNNAQVLKSGKPLLLQEWIQLADGLRCISTQLIPIFGKSGSVSALMGIGHDVTESKRMTEDLQISARQFESRYGQWVHHENIVKEIIKQAIPSRPIDEFLGEVTRILGEGLSVSRAFIFEYDQIRQKASNKHEWVADGIPPLIDHMQDVPVSSQPWLSKEMLAGRLVCVDAGGNCPSPELRELLERQGVKSSLMIPIFTFGNPYGFIGFDECSDKALCKMMDIELMHGIVRIIAQQIERNRLETDILASERLAAIGRLTASFTHEINNPLQSIILHLDSLKDHVDDEGRRELGFVADGFNRIAGIVAGLISVKKGSEQKRDLDLNTLLRSAYKLIAHLIDMKGINVRWNLDEKLPLFCGDGAKLQQVFINVMLNAYDSMERGGELEIASSPGGCHLTVEINDTGCGIETESLPYIFEPFFRTKEKSGAGLGLFVSHSVIAEHGGKIEVQSARGLGTKVKILLPLKRKCAHVKRSE